MNFRILFFLLSIVGTNCWAAEQFGKTGMYKVSGKEINLNHIIFIYDSIYFPKGSYKVEQLVIGNNKTILTDGFQTVFLSKIRTGIKPIILIQGSNVYLGKVTVIGRIENETGEWNHGVAVMAQDRIIKNIKIVGVRAINIRGDGLYIGTSANKRGYPTNVIASNINVENCYRNGVSIVTGQYIKISNIQVRKSGLFGFDIECDPVSLPLNNVTIENYSGGAIGVIGSQSIVHSITLKNMEFNGDYQGSTPAYPIKAESGITLRQSHSVNMDSISIINFDGFAIKTVKEKKESYIDNVSIKNLFIENVALKANAYNAVIDLMGFRMLKINKLKAKLQNDRSLFLGNDRPDNTQTVIITNADVSGGYFARYCKVVGDSITLTDAQVAFQNLHPGSQIANSKLSANIIVSGKENINIKRTEIKYKTQLCASCNLERSKLNKISRIK